MLELTALDRCDRCGAQAHHVASKPNKILMFCNHHYREHREALLEQYWIIESDVSPTEPVDTSVYNR